MDSTIADLTPSPRSCFNPLRGVDPLSIPASDYEKLGAFYFGRPYDLAARQGLDGLLLYDSKDLLTHAVCFGMTGSGKTGLCTVLLEEAAIDGIPAIVIDPKGDLGNLLLTFPDLNPADFEPWVDEAEARRQGMDTAGYAARQAARWREGLGRWGQDGGRIARLREAADFAIYTPGSEAGIPVSVLQSFAAPPASTLEDREALRDRVNATATALLSLLGIDANPLQSREHILLSNLFEHAWRDGRDLDLAALIYAIQSPPFQRVGVLDLDAFFPSKDRFGLAMALNGLLASPGFATWLAGEPLDIGAFLFTPGGKPRISIFSIAHLSDAERMFFVALLLNQVLSWMRQQAGTTSLRALLYMDEIAGYLPPVANPPSKQPLMTLMKQARAFGLGVVLATQNPMDLDYKALGNAGTWLLGRLQTERDQARVLDGLAGAAAGAGAAFDRESMETQLAALGQRVFLMYNVHEDAPAIFETRWAMSYLAGPMTRAQIQRLTRGRQAAAPRHSVPPPPDATGAARPVLPPEVPQVALPVRLVAAPGAELVYEPCLVGAAQLRFTDARRKVDFAREEVWLIPLTDGLVPVQWDLAEPLSLALAALDPAPREDGSFVPPPPAASQTRSYAAWNREFVNWLSLHGVFEMYRSPSLKEASRPGESERDFRIRLELLAREERDRQLEALRRKYAPKIETLRDRLRLAESRAGQAQEQARRQQVQSAITIGTSILGALFGRKAVSATNARRAGTAVGSMNRASARQASAAQSAERADVIAKQLADLEMEFENERASLARRVDPVTETFETIAIKPKKTGILVRTLALAWTPWWAESSGAKRPAWDV
ncbi:MAG: ATP-binding protein [Bryobacterales bacterium]|nr:ATP-binding protein [Bryobacterales bacterium]